MLKKLVKYIGGFFRPEKIYKMIVVTDTPPKLEKYRVYIVDNEGYSWQLVMLCPCGCNTTLFINLLPEIHPCWSYQVHKKTISIRPSIHRKTGCKSHFFITNGKVKWV